MYFEFMTQAEGFKRVRNRKLGASCRLLDPLGAGLYIFRWPPDETIRTTQIFQFNSPEDTRSFLSKALTSTVSHRSRRRWVDPWDPADGPALAADYRRLLETSAPEVTCDTGASAGGPIAQPLDRLVAALQNTAALWAKYHPSQSNPVLLHRVPRPAPIIAKPRTARGASRRLNTPTTPLLHRRSITAAITADQLPPTASAETLAAAWEEARPGCPGTLVPAAAAVEAEDRMGLGPEPVMAGPGGTAMWQARLCIGEGAALWAEWAGANVDLPTLEACWVSVGDGADSEEQDDDSDGVGVLACG
jgi:hypothetical protein